jgi:hypothetical protein
MSSWWGPLQQTFSQWSEHKDARLGAALAYARRLTLHMSHRQLTNNGP